MSQEITRTIPAQSLERGDVIIGSDTREYTIIDVKVKEERWYDTELDRLTSKHIVIIHCTNELGQHVTTTLPSDSSVKAITQKTAMDYHIERWAKGVAGWRLCTNCNEHRSVAQEWEVDDYICRLCRAALDSEA